MNMAAQCPPTAASSASSASAAPEAVKTWIRNPAWRWRSIASVAPIEPANLGRPPGKIPVAAEGAHARLVGTRDRDVGRDPVFRVADDDRLVLLLARNGRDGAVDDLVDREDPRL